MEYRTQEQFEEIVENCINGNWTAASRQCLEYSFYASDLIKFNRESDFINFDEEADIAILVEIATRMRYE